MTTLIKNYEILLKEYSEFHKDRDKLQYYNYICNFIINRLSIKESEKIDLLRHFQKQRPSETQYTEIYYNLLFVKDITLHAWFKHLQGNIEIRIVLLNEIISNLKQEQIN